ncbi:hypothetical protein [Caballeronia ptereochthonis]|uniref:hypothetical protein n=1 Tax=Caballeronia ptereochthonis TaxID=1777144 RepID=UPI00117F4588|nr:hypothetical protein [Caballeronia ptereochthonis]
MTVRLSALFAFDGGGHAACIWVIDLLRERRPGVDGINHVVCGVHESAQIAARNLARILKHDDRIEALDVLVDVLKHDGREPRALRTPVGRIGDFRREVIFGDVVDADDFDEILLLIRLRRDLGPFAAFPSTRRDSPGRSTSIKSTAPTNKKNRTDDHSRVRFSDSPATRA